MAPVSFFKSGFDVEHENNATRRYTDTFKYARAGCSDWYKGYPACADDAQSPINLAASSRTKAEVKSCGFNY